ncbi:MAG: Gfo/Idh/MocA family oxidoreductase [Planctomycetota bacterium]
MPHRLAFVSTAHIHTKDFLKRIGEEDCDATVHAIWDDVPERGRRYAEQAGCAFVEDLDALVSDDAVDGFVVCDATAHHFARLEKVLPVGKPTLCEKQVVATADEARQVRAMLEASAATLCSGYFQPYVGGNAAICNAVDDGAFGEVTHASYCNAHHAAYGRWFDSDDLRWFTQKELALGGAMIDMGTHAVHWLAYLFGKASAAWGTVANVSGQYPDVDDWGVGQLRFESGVAGRAEGSWVRHGGGGPIELWGTEGALVKQGDGWAVKRGRKEPVALPRAADEPTRIDRLISILDGALDEADHRREFEAEIAAVAIMEAIYRSSDSGCWEPVAGV